MKNKVHHSLIAWPSSSDCQQKCIRAPVFGPLTQLPLGLCPGWVFTQQDHDGLHHRLHQSWRAAVGLDLCHVLFVQRFQSLRAKKKNLVLSFSLKT